MEDSHYQRMGGDAAVRALEDTVADAALRDELEAAFRKVADFMLNRT